MDIHTITYSIVEQGHHTKIVQNGKVLVWLSILSPQESALEVHEKCSWDTLSAIVAVWNNSDNIVYNG